MWSEWGKRNFEILRNSRIYNYFQLLDITYILNLPCRMQSYIPNNPNQLHHSLKLQSLTKKHNLRPTSFRSN